MPSLQARAPIDHQALTPFPLSHEYPFAPWSDLGQRTDLHPVLASLWDQIITKFWLRGHPAAGKLVQAVFVLSTRKSFGGVGK